MDDDQERFDRLYHLEIFMPDSIDDLYASFSADTPFMTVQAGDLLNQVGWDGKGIPGTTILRAVNIEHIIWEGKRGVKHKVCVYTEYVEDTRKIRLARRKKSH